MNRDKIRILAVGQTPPPHRGGPIMLENLLRMEMEGIDMRHLRIELSSDGSQFGKFRWTKLFRLFVSIIRIIYARIILRPHILYYAPASFPRTTVLRDTVVLSAVRPFFPKTVLHFHSCGFRDLYEQLPRWQRWLFLRGIFHADGAIRVSDLAPDNGQHLNARKEYVVPNGIVDFGRCLSFPRELRQTSSDAPMKVLFVAQLSESKGLWILIEACAKLVARGVPARLHVMGNFENEDFESRTRAKVTEMNLENHVSFLGELTGPAKVAAFEEADVLCHPTFNDSFGLVIVEAMACGLPVVATHWTSIPTIVDEGRTGFLVEPHDSDAVADRLTRLAQDAELRFQMGLAGRQRFLREFTLSRYLERMRDVFLDVAGVSNVEERKPLTEAALTT